MGRSKNGSVIVSPAYCPRQTRGTARSVANRDFTQNNDRLNDWRLKWRRSPRRRLYRDDPINFSRARRYPPITGSVDAPQPSLIFSGLLEPLLLSQAPEPPLEPIVWAGVDLVRFAKGRPALARQISLLGAPPLNQSESEIYLNSANRLAGDHNPVQLAKLLGRQRRPEIGIQRKDWRSLRMRACVWTSAGGKSPHGKALALTIAPIRGSCQ
jgi:hypothetical protein